MKVPSFFIYPAYKYKTTTLKAPMAHKTYSQEQFIIKYYTLSISFYTYYNLNLGSQNINEILYYTFLVKSLIPSFTTNMLFLKKYVVIFRYSNSNYFSYYKFF
jgi:hypothetical protein